MLIFTGEASVREANAARFKETVQREFEAFKKERLASGELECQKLITAAQSHLTQVGTLFSALQNIVPFSPAFRSSMSEDVVQTHCILQECIGHWAMIANRIAMASVCAP